MEMPIETSSIKQEKIDLHENGSCQICNAGFKSMEEYENHMRFHQNLALNAAQSLLENSSEPGQSQEERVATFVAGMHETMNQNFQCKICGKFEATASRLKRHFTANHDETRALTAKRIATRRILEIICKNVPQNGKNYFVLHSSKYGF